MHYLQRFGLKHDVFPQDAKGATFFEAPGYERLSRRFAMLTERPGIGVLAGEVGVGKTSAIRNLATSLPRPDFQVIYLCEPAEGPAELYRMIAAELGLRVAHRRTQFWRELKRALIDMVDEQGVQPVLILDESHRLPEAVLVDLYAMVGDSMDSRSLLVLWLVGQPQLLSLLRMKHHAALASRIAARIHLAPLSTREAFAAFLAHGLQAAGASTKIVADPAAELLFRVSRGMPREAARLLREALIYADEQQRSMLDETILEAVLEQENL